MKQQIDYLVEQHVSNSMKILKKYTDRETMLKENKNVDKTKFFVIEHEDAFYRYNEINGKELVWKDITNNSEGCICGACNCD